MEKWEILGLKRGKIKVSVGNKDVVVVGGGGGGGVRFFVIYVGNMV